MGMYTELVLSVNIHNKPEIVNILKYMCDNEQPLPENLPNHPLFEEDGRWRWMFLCNSHYHVPRSHASIEFNDISKK
jgi:galactose mutarotase-like enzyme